MDRRERGDLIETFKIIKGIDKVDFRTWFTIDNSKRVRGHTFKLVKNHCKSNTRSCFFSQRVVNKWNGLPEEVVQAKTVNTFKNKLDKITVRN